ncbi:MAG TPA: ATP-dependent Clp protease proteolytic subunit [Steroidobacter sp.]|uniref:ATP-dependent Clp protease proteolytic subunit n=1 Tax=Steroidobacter sp. TaxID=1978227 RepID=UPI002ED95994
MSAPIFDAEREEKQPEKTERPEGLAEQLSFKSRFVLVFGEINHTVARNVCERLIALSQQSDAPIRVLISSPGGHVESGDAIHDMIRFINAPVTTIGTGWVASAGTHIFLAAEKQNRVCLPNTRFMIHQPLGGAGGQATDIAIQAKEILRTRERIARTIAKQTGRPYEKVVVDMERDFWLSANEAIDYGIVSRVVETYKDVQ